jgi:hypothetical protein
MSIGTNIVSVIRCDNNNKKIMKTISFLCLFFCGAVFIMNSCSKKSSSSGQTKTQLITASTWKYDTAGIDANGDGTIDEALPTGVIPSCVEDNTLTFNSDSTGTENEGAVKCDTAGAQTTSFTWSFNSSQTIINFPDSVFGPFGGTVNITSLTTTQLHLEKAVTESGLTFNIAVYLKH